MFTHEYIGATNEDFQHQDHLETIYVRPDDRYVVSLIVGYQQSGRTPGNAGAATNPAAAAYNAYMLTQDEDAAGTLWSVHDRVTGGTTLLTQAEFMKSRPLDSKRLANPFD